MLKDLKRSGITARQAKELRYTEITPERTRKLCKHKVKSYKIPYCDVTGKPTDFFRLRFLEDVKPPFSGKDTKLIRYWQPSHSLPRAYFPPILEWEDIIKNAKEIIYITEGEKKAAKACLKDIPTIGLGGVWSWRSKKEKVELIDDLANIVWKEREVGFIFDNDMYSNEKVMQALRALAKELTKRGAKIFIVMLPPGDVKIGLDDYLLKHNDLDDLYMEEWEESHQLWKLNEEIAFIMNPASYIHIPTFQHFDSAIKLSNSVYGKSMITKWVNDKPKQVNAMKAWNEWPCRREHSKVVYEPMGTSNGVFNIWKGWGTQPVEGDVKPFLKLVDHVFQGATKEHKEWFMQWLAYPVQHPGTKLMTAVLLHSIHQGVGKSLIGHIVGDIYGDNFNVIGQDELQDNYNDWLVGKQFILGEEILGTNKRQDADRVKNMITRETVGVNKKYVPRFNVKDCVNYIFTSNHPDALFLSRQDRRIFVHEMQGVRMPDREYDAIAKWRKNGGAAHLMHYLQTKVDTSKFSAYAPAPLTTAKMELTQLSLSDLDEFCDNLLIDPDSILRIGGTKIERDLFTVSELINIYDPEDKHHTTRIAMSKSLRRCGFIRKAVLTGKGTKKLFAVRQQARWQGKQGRAWADHYEESHVMPAAKKRKF